MHYDKGGEILIQRRGMSSMTLNLKAPVGIEVKLSYVDGRFPTFLNATLHMFHVYFAASRFCTIYVMSALTVYVIGSVIEYNNTSSLLSYR